MGRTSSARLRTTFLWWSLNCHRIPRAPPRHRLHRFIHHIQQSREVTWKQRETAARVLTNGPKNFTEDLEIVEVPAAANISRDSDPERPLTVAPRKHSIKTHFPKDQNCEVRKRTTFTRTPFRRRAGDSVPRAEKFGDLITADHNFLNEGVESRNNHRYSVVVQELATQWIQSDPSKTKNTPRKEVCDSFEPSEKPKVIYTDNSLELRGRDHEVREPVQPVMSQDLKEELQGNSERSQPTEAHDDAEARNDFWSIEGDFILSSSH